MVLVLRAAPTTTKNKHTKQQKIHGECVIVISLPVDPVEMSFPCFEAIDGIALLQMLWSSAKTRNFCIWQRRICESAMNWCHTCGARVRLCVVSFSYFSRCPHTLTVSLTLGVLPSLISCTTNSSKVLVHLNFKKPTRLMAGGMPVRPTTYVCVCCIDCYDLFPEQTDAHQHVWRHTHWCLTCPF